jgi:hypothetical protein
VIGPLKRIVIAGLATLMLSGCSSLMQSDLFSESFWAGSPLRVNDEAELGVAELAKGNYVTAEAHFRRALKSNPRDIDALIGAGILYQNTGQLTKAREMYEAVLALRPDDSHQFVVWTDITTKPAAQIASVNLSLLESGGQVQNANDLMPAPGLQHSPQQMAHANTPVAAPTVPVAGAPTTSAMLGRTASAPSGAAGQGTGGIGSFSGTDSSVISRFSTLRALRDQGLITQQEYAQRRQTNVGALMPLTSPPPAAGLDRPVPTSEQISGRLRAIGRALEMRAISVSQHAAERSMILDALMPAAPVVVSNPGLPPKGLMQAADAVRRIEQLKTSGYISSDEYARERQAIELSMRPAASPAMSATSATPSAAPAGKVTMLDKSKKAKMSGPQPAIHLASYRSQKQAERGWSQIRRAHGGLIGELDHAVSKVKLGRKGTYYRLKAGPLPNANAAKDMCRKLKRRRQFCEPSTMNAG